MPLAIFHGVGPVRPRYTDPVSLHRLARRRNRNIIWRTSAHPVTLALFLRPNFTSMAGRSGQLRGWPVPDVGFSTPGRSAAPSRRNEWRRFQNHHLEPPMNAFVLSGFASAEARAIARAALGTYIDHDPKFVEEISYRFLRLAEVFDLLEILTSEASFRGFEVLPQSIYGVIALANRELKMLDALTDAQFRVVQEAKP